MKNEGLLIVLAGFSGTGKGTIVRKVLEKCPGEYVLSVSATTRAPREGEVHGKEYFFYSEAQFQEMIRQDALLEYAGYVEHFYGTPKDYVFEQLNAGKNVILEIECRGAMQIRAAMPQAILIFVLPPSAEELERRLKLRGTESEEVIAKRLAKAAEEAQWVSDFDFVIVNDDLDRAVDAFTGIVSAVGHRTARNGARIARIRTELEEKTAAGGNRAAE